MANVNTENSKKQRGGQETSPRPPKDQIRMHLFGIETCVLDGEILVQTIFDRLDRATVDPKAFANAVNCYATCIGRNLALIREHTEHALASTLEGEGK